MRPAASKSNGGGVPDAAHLDVGARRRGRPGTLSSGRFGSTIRKRSSAAFDLLEPRLELP